MSEVNSFIVKAKKLIAAKNGQELSRIISLPIQSGRVHSSPEIRTLAESANVVNFTAQCRSLISNRMGMIIAQQLGALVDLLVHGNYKDAFDKCNAAYVEIVDNVKDESWTLPILTRLSNDFRILAILTDESLRLSSNEYLRDKAVLIIQGGWKAVHSDKKRPSEDPDSRLRALFAISNVLLKIYFRTNTLTLCKQLINSIDKVMEKLVADVGTMLAAYKLFPMCDVVTYKYYIGRVKMFEDKYDEARDHLCFALRYCPRTHLRNRQRILASLVPVEMTGMVLPSSSLSSVYGLHEYVRLGAAVKMGDIQSFEAIMRAHQRTFIRLGIFLVLEQVKNVAYRNLFKRIHQVNPASSRLDLNVFLSVFRWLGEDIDLDEVECILANLIFQKKIAGYISHTKHFLIVSKKEPFPVPKTDQVQKRTKLA